MSSDDLERLSDPTDVARRQEEVFLEDSLAKSRAQMQAPPKASEDGMCLNPNCGDDLPKGHDRFCNKECAAEFERVTSATTRMYRR